MSLIKDFVRSFFENHPEFIGETCKDCCDSEKTCAEQLLELLEKLE